MQITKAASRLRGFLARAVAFLVLFVAPYVPAFAADGAQRAGNDAPVERGFVYMTDKLEKDGDQYKIPNASEAVSILQTHWIVIYAVGMTRNVTYDFQFKASDAAGDLVLDATFPIVATGPSQYYWYGVSPDYRTHKDGKWRATVTVSGIGSFGTNYTVLPPRESERPELARYEGAREAAYRAFSEFWVGVSNHFGASEKDAFYYAALGGGDPNVPTFVGIGALQYRFVKSDVSRADQLNGISYHGTARFYPSVFRYYVGQTGWSPWKDVNRAGNELLQLFGFQANWSAGWGDLPENFGSSHELKFSVEQKDGNWRVQSDVGDLFVNDRRMSKENQAKVSHVDMPTVRRLIDTASDPRRTDRALGEDSKKTPVNLDNDVRNTMSLLRSGR